MHSESPHIVAGQERRLAVRLLVDAAANDRRQVGMCLLWLIVAAALEMLGPALSKHLIDSYLLPRNGDAPAIAALFIALLFSGLIASSLRYWQLAQLASVAMQSVRRLRERVFAHVLRLPMTFFDTAITGQLVSRVTNDTEAVKALYVQVLFVILDSSIICLGALTAMAWLDWRLMLTVLTLLPAIFVIVWLYQRWSAPAVSQTRAARSDINVQMAESIAGMPLLQASNATLRFTERFTRTNQIHYRARFAELRANAWLLRPMLDLLNVIMLTAVLYSFAQSPLDSLAIGVLYAFLSYIGRVVDPLIQITQQFSNIQQSVVAAARVNKLLTEPLAVRGEQHAVITHGAVSLRKVDFGYLPNQPVLQQLSMEVAAGSFVGIVGYTGSGKSTLLSLLLRFYTPQAGEILIDDIALADFSEDAFRASIGLVPQEPFLLAANVRDNIDMGRGLNDAAIENAARAAQAHDFVMALEHGYTTQLGEGGARLSTGQKQLLAMARALAGQPRILFLDEATSHIDSETEQIVQQALTALRGKVTIIAIAHRLSTLRDADNIVVLSHGKIAEQGNHDALMAQQDGIYQRLYWLQQMVE